MSASGPADGDWRNQRSIRALEMELNAKLLEQEPLDLAHETTKNNIQNDVIYS